MGWWCIGSSKLAVYSSSHSFSSTQEIDGMIIILLLIQIFLILLLIQISLGWCYVQNVHKLHSITVSEVFSQVFVYMTYLTLLVLYISIRCSIRCKVHT